MTKADIGKFCSHCSKTVVDFTTLTDNEVIRIVEQTSGKLCGRLTKQQLNRLLETKRPANNSSLYKILAGALLLGTTGSSFASECRIPLQKEIAFIGNEKLIGRRIAAQEQLITDSLKNVVQGKVLDAHAKEPLPFVSVWIKDTKTGVFTDLDGYFKLVIPDSLLTDTIVLVARYTGYEIIEISIDRKDLPISKDLLIVQIEETLLGEICIVKKKKWWQFWKRR